VKTTLRNGFLWAVILLCTLPRAAWAQQIDLENVPQDVLMQFADGPFAETYSISGRINPFYLRGDFDGDGKPDYAVLVASKKDHSSGIAIWLSSKAKILVLGAGNAFRVGAEETRSFDVIDTWQVYAKKPVEQGVGEGPPPKLIGEAILAGKKESASGLIFWNGKRFAWYQQGD
jgi:hypothetical protein